MVCFIMDVSLCLRCLWDGYVDMIKRYLGFRWFGVLREFWVGDVYY